MYEILNGINGPEDVKKLSLGELETLSAEIREALFNRLTKIGGHFGPNFGIVEAEIEVEVCPTLNKSCSLSAGFV